MSERREDIYRAALAMAAETLELIGGEPKPRMFRVGEARESELMDYARRGLARNAAKSIRQLLDSTACAGVGGIQEETSERGAALSLRGGTSVRGRPQGPR